MRIFYTTLFAFVLSAFSEIASAQNLPESYQRPKEIPKPLLEDRLKDLLPVIRGIYANEDKYGRRRNWSSEDLEYSYFEKPKLPPEKAITLQNLKDVATVIEFLNNRKAFSTHDLDRRLLPKPRDLRSFNLPTAKPLLEFDKLWPDDVNFVLGPSLRGCDTFCRILLLEAEFASVTVLETELLEGNSNPEPVRATRYSLDDGACKTPENGRDLIEGQDETLNFEDRDSISAMPDLGLCFQYETVSIPENGAFIYFNHASPFWPDEFERTHMRKERIETGTLLASQRIIFPKAFEDLETEFSVPFTKHLAYEFRSPGLQTKPVFVFEATCIRPHVKLGEGSLNLLIASINELSESNIWGNYQRYLIGTRSDGICTGDYEQTRTHMPISRPYRESVSGQQSGRDENLKSYYYSKSYKFPD